MDIVLKPNRQAYPSPVLLCRVNILAQSMDKDGTSSVYVAFITTYTIATRRYNATPVLSEN